MEDNQGKVEQYPKINQRHSQELVYPRIYTIHSQKGGVGKTSIAIAIAGFASIFHSRKALIIDGDLTGTSLIDVPGWSDNKKKPTYFNDLILATPPDFLSYTSGKKSSQKISKFYQKIPGFENIYYMPASPCFQDILKVIPLISQEDFLNFFRHRLEDIVKAVITDEFDVVIIDHPPGLFGISNASLRMILDGKLNLKDKPVLQALIVTTQDPSDYRALIPSLSKILITYGEFKELGVIIDMILNRASSKEGRFDPPFEYGKILNKVKEFPDDREVEPELLSLLLERAKKTGALACPYVSDFDITLILNTIQSLKGEDDVNIQTGMEDWCKMMGKAVGLY